VRRGSRLGRGRGSLWQPAKAGPWYAWAYESGRWVRRSTGLRDRSAARSVADKWLREGERAESTGDVVINHERRPLVEHIEDFAKAKRDDPRDLTRGHIDRQIESIKDMCELAGWTKLNQISLASAQELLQRLRRGDVPQPPEPKAIVYPDPTDPRRPKQAARPGGGRTGKKAMQDQDDGPKGLAPATLNLRRAYLKSFTRWLHQKGRIIMDPLAGLTRFRTQGHETKRRRALSIDDQAKLVRAAEIGPIWSGLSGPDRAMLYRFALATGFRKNECASLSVASFALDAPIPHVRLAGKSAKNRKTVEQPLPRSVLPVLRSWLAGRERSGAAWPGLSALDTAAMVKRDAKAAGIAERTEDGILDFHALRHTFGTTIVKAGTSPAEAQRLMRHSTMDLTMLLYTHLTGSDIAASVSRAFGSDDATSTAESAPEPVAETRRAEASEGAEKADQVASALCRNSAVHGASIGTVPDESNRSADTGAPSEPAENKVNTMQKHAIGTVSDEWERPDSNRRHGDYESPTCDSKSLAGQGLTAGPGATLQQDCNPAPAHSAIGPRTRHRQTARDRAAAGLTPNLERAFGHIAELGSLAATAPHQQPEPSPTLGAVTQGGVA
jgi:integrase